MSYTIPINEAIEVVGEERILKLAEKYPGGRLNMPKKVFTHLDLEARNQYIKNLYYSASKSADEIAEMVGLSADYVRKIICQK